MQAWGNGAESEHVSCHHIPFGVNSNLGLLSTAAEFIFKCKIEAHVAATGSDFNSLC